MSTGAEPGNARAMQNGLARGAVAGAVGTLALEATTYLDLALRGRPPSSAPADAVGRVTEVIGVSLSSRGRDAEPAHNRRTGIGALLGYATGVGIGIGYGAARQRWPRIPPALSGVALGAAAMMASDLGLVALRVTDPRRWGLAGWLSDIVPHAVYGFAAATTFDQLRRA